ncbi:MAG TPA: ribosomal protein S18-alanine N-acetyltransferase [Steroidobacteraceae bacterium]|jgi:ribosomal-protein-alanine N-acetyltransferase
MAVVRQEAIGLPELAIRAMHESDIVPVLGIERASYAFPWTEGILRDCLRVNYTCRVAEIGAATAGYGILSVAAGEAHLLNLCVADSYRCRGIGRLLLAHLLQAAVAAGARDAYLEARPSNTGAIRLYQSLGFVQIGMRRGYYQALDGREDAIVLKRRID